MSEQDFHDLFYSRGTDGILSSPIFQTLRRRIVDDIIARTSLNRGSRVLSLGCGTGEYECLLAQTAEQVVGYDLSPIAIERARSLAATEGASNVQFQTKDILAADGPMERGDFDIVCALGLLHHLSDDGIRHVLRMAKLSLKSGGIFYMIDPSAKRFVRNFKWLFAAEDARYHSSDERDLVPEQITEVFRAEGYAPQRSDFDFFFGPAAWVLPKCPLPLARTLDGLDRLIMHVPWIRAYGSSFVIVATK